MVCHLHSICFFKCAYVGVCCMDHIWAFQWSIIRQCVWCRLYNINVNSWCSIGIMNLVTDNIWHNANWIGLWRSNHLTLRYTFARYFELCMYTDYFFRKKKKEIPPCDVLICKWQATCDQISLEPHLIQALPQCLAWHKAFKRHLDQMGIPFDPGLCGASGPESFFSSAGYIDRFIEGWEGAKTFLLPFFFSSFNQTPTFINVLWHTGLSLIDAPFSSHLEYMNKRLEEFKLLKDTDPLY